jgi:hypothetical protein
MPEVEQQFIVYVDTSYLSHMPNEQVADWNKLLLHAKKCKEDLNTRPKLEIHIHQVALEEYRTQSRDGLLATIEKTKSSIQSLARAWSGNPVGKSLPLPIPFDILDTYNYEIIDSESRKITENFIDHGVVKVKSEPHHDNLVRENYFAWGAPFDGVTIIDRADKNHRENRRKHIPDAWIYFAALDMREGAARFLCLCKDGNLTKALKAKNLDVFSDAAEIWKILNAGGGSSGDGGSSTLPTQPVVPSGGKASVSQQSAPPVSFDVDRTIQALQDTEKLLQVRILGYVHWFAPISKSDLSNLLQEKGHIARIINNASERLALSGLITDTGNHYIPGNKAVCEQAANSIMSEILEILDK